MPGPTYKYAAIDAGSNAVRLLLCNVIEEQGIVHFKNSEFIRIPLRLGEDVYQYGKISSKKGAQFIKTMNAFKLLVEVFNPVSYRACATASLREASNGAELIAQIKKDCGLKIEIISGKEEAEIIYSNHIEELLEHDHSYLYIDVGGGSTELTVFDHGKVVNSQSFNVGAIRWLKGKVTEDTWNEFKEWVKVNTDGHAPLTAIGSGGNINKAQKILGKKDAPLSYSLLKQLYTELKNHTVEDRMEKWQLNPDRADVIVPACKIYLTAMKIAGIENIIVPQICLADGIIHQLHERKREIA